MEKLLNKYIKKNKKGASMMDFFIYALVVLLIGGLVFIIGNVVRGGLQRSKTSLDKVSETQTNQAKEYDNTGYSDVQ